MGPFFSGVTVTKKDRDVSEFVRSFFFYFYFYVAALTLDVSLKSWRKKEGLCFGRWVTFFLQPHVTNGQVRQGGNRCTDHPLGVNTMLDPLLPTDT